MLLHIAYHFQSLAHHLSHDSKRMTRLIHAQVEEIVPGGEKQILSYEKAIQVREACPLRDSRMEEPTNWVVRPSDEGAELATR